MMASLGGAYFFSNFHRLALGVLGTQISADLGLTPLQTGTLGSALFYSYALMQVPCGYISDHFSARVLVALACFLTALGTIWFGCASSFLGMVAARALTGFSTSLIYIPALSAIRRQFGDASFGTMTGIMVALGQSGAVCAASPLKLASSLLGWRNTFFIIGGATVVLGIMAWYLIQDDEGITTLRLPFAEGVKSALTPMFVAVAVWFFITGGTRLAFQGLWGGLFFIKGCGLSSSVSGLLLTFVSLGCIFGSLLLGRVSDMFGCVRTMLVSSFALAAVWLLFSLSSANVVICLAALCIVLGSMGAGGFTVGFASVKLFASKKYTGLLTGILNLFAFLGSAVLTQLSGSFMGVLTLSESQKYRALTAVFAVLCCATTFAVLLTSRQSKR